MFFPARLGDTISHDGVVVAGVIMPATGAVATVLIEGQPAATAGCLYTCNGLTAGGPAHPPLPAPVPIIGGTQTVIVQGFPLLRWSPAPDLTPCGAMLGDPKMSATRTVTVGK